MRPVRLLYLWPVAVWMATFLFGQTPSHTQSGPASQDTAQKRRPAEPLWQQILRISGISATPSAQRGPEDEPKSGDICETNLASMATRELTHGGAFRSPVFAAADRGVLALAGNKLVRISLVGAQPEELFAAEGIYKLVGWSRDAPDMLLVVTGDAAGHFSPAFLSIKSRQITAIPFDPGSPDDRAALAFLKASERVYDGKTLFVRTATKESVGGTLEWTDVYIREANAQPVNVSRCDDANCGQPSLSADGRLVVFVKAER